MYQLGDIVVVKDKMQSGYKYELVAPAGGDFDHMFAPFFSPEEMLALGVFEGKYCNDCRQELPEKWFEDASVGDVADPTFNYFGVKSRQALSVWRQRGWIHTPDPRGLFQWYCRYWLGRRMQRNDELQIRRWRAFRRHAGQVQANCKAGDLSCRPRQRQSLLQWAHNPFI